MESKISKNLTRCKNCLQQLKCALMAELNMVELLKVKKELHEIIDITDDLIKKYNQKDLYPYGKWIRVSETRKVTTSAPSKTVTKPNPSSSGWSTIKIAKKAKTALPSIRTTVDVGNRTPAAEDKKTIKSITPSPVSVDATIPLTNNTLPPLPPISSPSIVDNIASVPLPSTWTTSITKSTIGSPPLPPTWTSVREINNTTTPLPVAGMDALLPTWTSAGESKNKNPTLPRTWTSTSSHVNNYASKSFAPSADTVPLPPAWTSPIKANKFVIPLAPTVDNVPLPHAWISCASNTSSPPHRNIKWGVGDKCMARWRVDRNYYAAKIEGFTDKGKVNIIYDIYGSKDIVSLSDLKRLGTCNGYDCFDNDINTGRKTKVHQKKSLKIKKEDTRRKVRQSEFQEEKKMWKAFKTKISQNGCGSKGKSWFSTFDDDFGNRKEDNY